MTTRKPTTDFGAIPPEWVRDRIPDDQTTVLVHDPDIGPMQSVVLPATSIVLEGVPVVCDVDRELLVMPTLSSPDQIRDAIHEHERRLGRKPRVVILPSPQVPR